MRINNITLMINCNEREGDPIRGVTLLRIKKGNERLEGIVLNQEMNLFRETPFEDSKTIKSEILFGKLLDDGEIKWLNGVRCSFSPAADQEKKILGYYHNITSTKLDKIYLLYDGPGEYVVQGNYKIEDEKRITWDYFKVVEEE
jgi:hypothetical protein